jgi:hypothetical protein
MQTRGRLLARPSTVCGPNAVAFACSDTTGGLRPRLLCCNAHVCRRKNDICDAQTHIRPRAAGVSPPWFGFASATRIGFCGPITFRPARSFPVPRLAYASRSWVHARKSSQMGGGALQRRFVSHGGLTPPALGFVCGRRCRCGLTADESVSFSHGWLTPGALVSVCERLPAKNDFCDAQTQIRPRAAGVSPPWVGLALATAIGFCGLITFRPARSFPVPRLAYASRSWVHARKSSQMGGGALQRRFVSHGGLTPPALVSGRERLPAKKRFLRCTHAHSTKSGGRQPAVVRQTRLRRHQRDCSQDRRQYVGRTPLHRVQRYHGGLTPPRSCVWARTSAGEKRFFRCTNAHPTKSGGCQPAVVRIGACNGDRFLRTDYVSPRTVASRTTAGSRQPLLVHARKSSQMGGGALQRRFVSHGGLTPPALVLQCERLPAKNDFCDAQTQVRPRAAGVSPPWFDKHVYADTGAVARKTAESMCANHHCHRVQRYHGGLTPPALVLRCERLPAKNDFCDAQTHIRPRAAGVSPPWFDKHVYADTSAIARKTVESMCADHPCHRVQRYHGGLTPPALGFVCGRRCRCGLTADESVSFSHGWLTPAALVSGCERLPAKNDFFDAQTRIRTRAAGVSPPWFGLALATATGFCRPITFRPAQSLPAPRLAYASRSWSHARKSSQMGGGALQRRSVFHGGLTPPLLVSCAGVVADVG